MNCEFGKMNTDLDISVSCYSHTTPVALGNKIEKIMANDFLNVFYRFLFCPRFLRFLPFYPIMIFN